ncbi:hypothetical protein ccbrp13_02900 [Ktedonobacteria bacterium brp13]|nr:hypothetical protein ccbrp13_02900 [Ktedonobacteria bacterium brp13]
MSEEAFQRFPQSRKLTARRVRRNYGTDIPIYSQYSFQTTAVPSSNLPALVLGQLAMVSCLCTPIIMNGWGWFNRMSTLEVIVSLIGIIAISFFHMILLYRVNNEDGQLSWKIGLLVLVWALVGGIIGYAWCPFLASTSAGAGVGSCISMLLIVLWILYLRSISDFVVE